MTKTSTRNDGVALPAQSQSLRNKLMFAASAGILAMVAPSGFYGMRAEAQKLPDECLDTDPNDPNAVTNNIAQDGETLECIAPDPATPIDPFYTNARDLTIQVGGVGADPASTVIGSATLDERALSMTGPGVQTLEIRESGSIINNATGSVNTTVNIDAEGSISLTNRGVIDNQSNQTGENGDLAVRTKVTQGGGDLVIDSTDGRVLGGVYVYSYGNGKVDLDFGEITSTSGDEGLYVYPL